jgi:hypothetical protein
MSLVSQHREVETLATQIEGLLQQCKIIARRLKVGRPSRMILSSEFSLVLPSQEVATRMVNLYFQSFESAHRILHEPSFWTEYQNFWNFPDNVTTETRLKILLVVGIGSSLDHQDGPDTKLRSMIHQWIYAAQIWLSGPLEKDRLDIPGLQIYCLTILAREIFSVGGDLVWMSMGSLIHRAMQMGLHRDPKHFPEMPVLQAELRRRLWATVLEMVAQSSLDTAMPPRIALDEFDTEPPSNVNDDEIDESSASIRPHPRETYTSTSMQLILLESLPTRLRILRLLNGIHTEISYLDALAPSSELTEVLKTYSIFVKENAEFISPFRRNLLVLLLRRFMLLLHFPFAEKARDNPLFQYSLKASLDAALAIISPEPNDSFSYLMTMGGGMFRKSFRIAFVAITLELLAETESQRVEGTLHHKIHYRGYLKQAVRDMITFSANRIKHGETNVKSHMFLSMVLAQVDAAEIGSSCELKIAQSAKDSLEFCLDLLQKRADLSAQQSTNDAGITPTSLDSGLEDFGLDVDLESFFQTAGFSWSTSR